MKDILNRDYKRKEENNIAPGNEKNDEFTKTDESKVIFKEEKYPNCLDSFKANAYISEKICPLNESFNICKTEGSQKIREEKRREEKRREEIIHTRGGPRITWIPFA